MVDQDNMNGQEGTASNDPRKTTVRDTYDFSSEFGREDYADAHYEPVDETTVPPRYYTPHEKTVRETKAKRENHTNWITLMCMALAAGILGGICGSVFTAGRMEQRIAAVEGGLEEYQASLSQSISDAVDAAQVNNVAVSNSVGMSPGEIYEQAIHQVVGVRTEITLTNFFGMTSSGAVNGSGFIITDDGYIMTNYHVVEDAYERRLDVDVMTYDGNKYSAAIVGVEPSNDIALLKIEAEGLMSASFSDSDSIHVGDEVYAVGNPLGELEFSMSTGHVSALDRVISTDESESINMFQIDAAVNEGNSGGPVYDSKGRVIGIVTAKYSSSGVEGLGFAIPSNDARTISDDLMTKGYVTGKASLGIKIASGYNAMYAQYYGMPLGAYIAEITPNSASEKAGLQPGDIITAIGTYEVQDYNDLKSALRHFSAYEEAELKVYRAGEEIHVSVVFDEQRPELF